MQRLLAVDPKEKRHPSGSGVGPFGVVLLLVVFEALPVDQIPQRSG